MNEVLNSYPNGNWQFAVCLQLNVAVQCLAVLFHIQEVSSSVFGPKTAYSDIFYFV
jgi:hypothetical protein